MKQLTLFEDEFKKEESIYTSKIVTPIYEPKNQKPHIIELVDVQKAHRLVREIEASNLPIEEKKFLLYAARRHYVFNYEKIADYYAHASKEMQEFMERSALVIVDFNKAYQLGYVNLAHEIANEYINENE